MKKGLIVLGIGALLAMSSAPSWSMDTIGKNSNSSLRQNLAATVDYSTCARGSGTCDGTGPHGPNGGGGRGGGRR